MYSKIKLCTFALIINTFLIVNICVFFFCCCQQQDIRTYILKPKHEKAQEIARKIHNKIC